MVIDAAKNKSIKGEQKKKLVLVTGNEVKDNLRLFARLEHYFVLSGYNLCMEVIPARANLPRWLEEISGQRRASLWLLCSVAKEIQAWFERRGRPALILGSRHAGIHLPDLDADYQAVCRHAAQTLLRFGHRRIVLLTVDSGLAGDLASEKGFQEAFSRITESAAKGRIVHHKGNAARLGRLLAHLFGGAKPPTAMIVTYPCYMMTVMGYLARMGIKIPQDVSLICRDHDPFFEFLVPSPSCYHLDFDRFARRAAQLAIQIEQGYSLPAAPMRILPQFIPGETIAACGRHDGLQNIPLTRYCLRRPDAVK